MKYLQSFSLFEGKKKKKKKDKRIINIQNNFDITMVANVDPDSTTQMNPMNKMFPYHI